MERDSGNTATRCNQCGSETERTAPDGERVRETYQVVVACATCGTAFVALARN